jgi:hypothetical protein
MSDLNAIAPVEDTRREKLLEQFEQVESAPAGETVREDVPRDEQGKFAAKELEQTMMQQAQESVEQAEEPVWKRPPASWKKDYHDVWQTADDRMKEYAWQREEQMKAGVQPLMEKARLADQFQEVLNPYMDTIRGLNIEPTQAVKALMEADHALRFSDPQQKQQLFMRLAQQYGVTLGGELQQQPFDPNISALQQELNRVRGEVMSWKEQQEQMQNQSLMGEINSFALKAEHFEEARPTMISLLQSGVASTLEEAYEKAIRLDDNLYQQVQQSRQAQAETQQKVVANQAAKKARAAAVSVRSAAPGATTATKAQDRRSLLAEQFDSVADRL